MKNLCSKICLALLVIISASSCITTNKGFQSSPVISRNVDLDPIKADIHVDEAHKLTGESNSVYFLFFRIEGDNTLADGINYSTDASASLLSKINPLTALKTSIMNSVRSAAAYKALSTGDYDFLVHPNYIMTTKNYLGIVNVYKCTVTGYGAKYKNFRTEKQKIIIANSGKEYVFPDTK